MTWLSNTLGNPTELELKGYKMTREEHEAYKAKFIVGEPQTARVPGAIPAEQLKRDGYVGLYRRK